MSGELLTTNQLLKMLPISASRQAFYQTVKREAIPHVKIGARMFFDRIEVEQWLAERHVGKRRSGTSMIVNIPNTDMSGVKYIEINGIRFGREINTGTIKL